MTRTQLPRILAAMFAVCCCIPAFAETNAPIAKLTVHVDRPGIKVSPTLYGAFFEEINRAGEGGLYAEQVSNRSFEDSPAEPQGWTRVPNNGGEGAIAIDTSQPLNESNTHALRIDIKRGRVGAANEGFKGIAVKPGGEYLLSLHARAAEGFTGPFTATLENTTGRVLASAKIDGLSSQWQKFTCTLKAGQTDVDPAARLVIASSKPGTIWIDVVSLFPADTWQGKPKGLRADLAEKVAALKPAFFRFPGGCWVEGETLEYSYHWKDTIGDVERRKNNFNIWNYYCTNALGFHEYLEFCEQLGAAPLFVINVGMSHKETVPMSDMQPCVQDALDALEYANGPVESRWGGERARNGHPSPFNLKLIEVGNENGGADYDQRYALFYDAIKARYPDVKIIGDFWKGSPPKSRPYDLLDEHYYGAPGFFLSNADRYDRYDRKGPKIYVGEYAVTRDCGGGNLRGALAEAAFMTGLERNSDVVLLASYAPLLCNVHYKMWNPNAINFDSTRSYATPSYYVQQMFATNRADVILPAELEVPARPETPHGAVGLGTWNTRSEFKDLKVTRGEKTLLAADFKDERSLADAKLFSGEWSVQDGAVRQTTDRPGAFLVAGDPSWSDYTIQVKARKLDGREGFLVRFNSLDRDTFTMWNVGGYRNLRHAIELVEGGATSQLGNPVPGKIEPGRWYDLRVEVSGQRIRCYLDGKLTNEATYAKRAPIYCTAGRAGDEVILKLVNVSTDPQPIAINIDGAGDVASKAKQIVLTSPSQQDENSLDSPTKVVPTAGEIDSAGAKFQQTLPANSVTILRVSAKSH
jgi:alpha-L-arabinofuranosidase